MKNHHLPTRQTRGWAAISLVLIASLLLAGCSTAAPLITPVPTSANVTPTSGVDPYVKLVPAAKAFVDQMAQGDFATADSTFDATMKGAMPEAKLKDAWNQVLGQAGAFKAQLGTATITQGAYHLVLVTCQFEKSVIAVQVAYNDQEQISGLYFKPGVAPVTTPAANLENSAKAVIEHLVKGDYAAVVTAFDPTLQSRVTADSLKQAWEALIAKQGAYQQQTAITSGTVQGYQDVVITCQFEKGAMDIRVVFNAQGQMNGLNFLPAGTGAATPQSYSPPTYANSASFHESEVTVGSGEWALPGTLTVPNGSGPFPAVVLVHGSGPNDRDETIGPNKVFRDLAWGLASQGIAVLRYDKRTKVHAAQFTADVLATLTVKQETTDDAHLAVDLLRQTAGIDPKRVFVLGHSLGATVAPRIGQQDPSLAGLILLAGLTRPLEDTVLDQVKYLDILNGALTDAEKADIDKLAAAVARVKDPNLSSAVPASDLPLNTPAAYWLDLRGYHPDQVAAALAMPLLVLQGERDYQVTPADNFPAWQSALAGKANATLKLYPGLNHLFISGTGEPNPQEYETAGHVDEQVVKDIAQFVKAN